MFTVRALLVAALAALTVLAGPPALAGAQTGYTLTDGSGPSGLGEVTSTPPESSPPDDAKGSAPKARATVSWPRVAITTPGAFTLPAGGPKPASGGLKSFGGKAPSKQLPFPRPGQELTFSAEESIDLDGTIATYDWRVYYLTLGEKPPSLPSRFVVSKPPDLTSDQPVLKVTPPNGAFLRVYAILTVVDDTGLRSSAAITTAVVPNAPPKLDLQRFKTVVKAKTVTAPTTGLPSPDFSTPPAFAGPKFNQKVLEGLAITNGRPTRIFANGADSDGTIVKYEFDVVPLAPGFERDNGSSDEYGFTASFPGTRPADQPVPADGDPITYRVRATDDEGAVTEATLAVKVQPACEGNTPQGVLIGKHVRLTAGSACISKGTSGGKTVYTAVRPGDITINGILTGAPTGTRLVLNGDGTVSISIPNAAPSAINAAGARLVFPPGKIAWTVSSNGTVVGLGPSGLMLAALKVTSFGVTKPTMAGGKPFKVDVVTAAPEIFNGSTASKSTPFTAYVPGATAAKAVAAQASGFELGPMNLDIAGITIKNAKLKYDGDDNWDIAGGFNLEVPVRVGTVNASATIRNGAFGSLHADTTFASPIPLPIASFFLKGINFDIDFSGEQESRCVPNVGKKRISLQELRDMLISYGWSKASVDELIPDLLADYGRPDFALCGGLDFTFGPKVLGKALLDGNVSLGIATYPDRPAVFRIIGKPITVAGLFDTRVLVEAYTNGYFNARAGLLKPVTLLDALRFDARLGFEANVNTGQFNADAYAEVCIIPFDLGCASAQLLVSSKGAGACFAVYALGGKWTPGATLVWGGSFTPYLDGCDVGEVKAVVKGSGGGVTYEVVPPPGSASAKAALDLPPVELLPGASTTFPIKAGLPGAVIAVTTKDKNGLAHFTVTPPGGSPIDVAASPDTTKKIFRADNAPKIIRAPKYGVTNIILPQPKAGDWTVTAAADSEPIGEVRVSEGAPRPTARFGLGRSGVKRTLDLELKNLRPGLTAKVIEQGASGGQVITRGRVTGATMRIKRTFTPRAAVAEPRYLSVVLERNGIPVAKLTPRSPFMSSPPLRAAGPRDLRINRGTRGVSLKWDPVAGAKYYRVSVVTSDKRRVNLRVTRPSVAVPLPLRSFLKVRYTVQAVDALGVPGKTSSLTA